MTGALLAGRSTVLEASRTLFAGPLRDQRARYELAEVLFVRPDVALARHTPPRSTSRARRCRWATR